MIIKSSSSLSIIVGIALAACAGTAKGPGPSSPKAATYDAVPIIPSEVLFGNPTKTDPRLSADGSKLAYLAPHEGVLNVWVKTVGRDDDKVVSNDKVRGIRSYFWAPSGEQILYIQDKGCDENWHIYAVSAAGGEGRRRGRVCRIPG